MLTVIKQNGVIQNAVAPLLLPFYLVTGACSIKLFIVAINNTLFQANVVVIANNYWTSVIVCVRLEPT
jgi:hypothetical protein